MFTKHLRRFEGQILSDSPGVFRWPVLGYPTRSLLISCTNHISTLSAWIYETKCFPRAACFNLSSQAVVLLPNNSTNLIVLLAYLIRALLHKAVGCKYVYASQTKMHFNKLLCAASIKNLSSATTAAIHPSLSYNTLSCWAGPIQSQWRGLSYLNYLPSTNRIVC